MNSFALLTTAILGVCTSLCGLANAADTNSVTATFVRAFTRLKTDGCDRSSLDAFSQALNPVQDREVRAVGCTIYALGSASLGNYQAYLATYKALASAYPASPYLKQLGGSSVTDSCKTCDGTGQAEQTCAGCNGKREFSGFGGVMRNCPRCRGSGTMVAKCTTCQGRRQVFSPERAGETLKAFLETAETTLASTYGPLGNYLPEQKPAQLAATEAQTQTTRKPRQEERKSEVAVRLEQNEQERQALVDAYLQACTRKSSAGIEARLAAERLCANDGEPSVETTSAYIKDRISSLHSDETFNVGVEDGLVRISRNSFEVLRFYLMDLDPTKINYKKGILQLNCRDDEPNILKTQLRYDGHSSRKQLSLLHSARLEVGENEEETKKMGRAFQRLIQLFGGTAEAGPESWTDVADAIRNIERKKLKISVFVKQQHMSFDRDTGTMTAEIEELEFYGKITEVTILKVDVRTLDPLRTTWDKSGSDPATIWIYSGAGKKTIEVTKYKKESGNEEKARPFMSNRVSLLWAKTENAAESVAKSITFICKALGWKPDPF